MSDSFDLGMVFTGDASSASAAAAQASSALDGVSDAQTRVAKTAQDMAGAGTAAASGLGKVQDAATGAAASGANLDKALADLQADLAAARGQAEQAAAGMTTLSKANADLAAELATSQRSIASLAGQVDVLETRLASGARTHGEASKGLGNVGIAAAETEHAVRAFADSVNAGQDPVRALTLELPRLTQAAGFMGGALGAVGEFLAGPWGIALTVGVSFLAPLIEHLLDTPSAAEAAKKALEEVAQVNRDLASAIDQTNGKIDEQNKLLGKAAILSAPKAIDDANRETLRNTKEGFEAANKVISDFALTGNRAAKAMFGLTTITRDQVVGANDLTDAVKDAHGNLNTLTTSVDKLAATNPALRPLRDQLNGLFDAATKSDRNAKAALGNLAEAVAANSDQGALTKTVVDNQIALATATDKVSKAQAQLNILKQKEAELFKQPYGDARNSQIQQVAGQIIDQQKALEAAQDAQKSVGTTRTRKAPDKSNLLANDTQFANDIIGQHDDTPKYTAELNKQLGEVQLRIDALNRSGLKASVIQPVIDKLNDAKAAVQNDLEKPFNDFMQSQEQAFQQQKLIAAGQGDQAAAFSHIIAIQKQQGTLDDDHLASIVDSVEKLHQQADAYELIRQRQSILLEGLNAYKADFEGLFTGAEKLKDLPKKLVVDFKTLSGKLLFNDLFGSAFQDLKNKITGADGVSGVTDQLKAAIAAVKPTTDDFSSDLSSAGTAAANLADALNEAAAALNSKGMAGAAGGLLSTAQSLPASTGGAGVLDSLSSAITRNLNSTLFAGNSDTGSSGVDADGAIVVNAPRKSAKTSAADLTQMTLAGILKKGLNITDEAAKKIGRVSSDLVQGAAVGGTAGSIFSSLTGTKGSSLGGSICGALGEVAGKALGKVAGKALGSLGSALGPIGSIAGGILGSVIGGLFKKVKTGGATITDTSSNATLSGNSTSYENNANSLAGSVQDGIAQIAQQLGGTAGSFGGITIGQYKDKYRVNTVSTKLGGSSSPVAGLTSYDMAEAAVAAAIQDAVAKGAVSGLDAAVQKALASNSDINKSLAEALQVKQVETLIGGLGATIKNTFDTFDATAKSNLTIAQKYGLDVVKLEQATADQRTKLVQDTLKQATSSLQDLLDNLNYGDLADGDAATKRQAQLQKIATTKALADTGDQDAIDSLASLYEDLVNSTKDAFGTAGAEYASDKATATTGAQDVIQHETDLINSAAGLSSGTTDAVNATTAAVNENNDLMAQSNAILRQIAASVGVSSTAAPSFNAISYKSA